MIPTLRVLTKKSKLGFGAHKDLTVEFILENKKRIYLISPYFKLTSISYTEEVLNELGITEEYRITKPGSDKEMYHKFLRDKEMLGHGIKRQIGADKLRKFTKPFSKGYLQSKNQGH